MSAPKVWSKFSVTRDTSTIKFRAIEPPPERFDDVVELVMNYFCKEEAMNKAAGIAKNKDAVEEFKTIITKAFKGESFNIVVCCLDNEDDEIGEIVGSSITSLIKRDEPLDLAMFQPQTKEVQTLFKMSFALKCMYNLMDELNIDKYYYGRGAVVHPKYRGYGIAQEFLRIRRVICKEQGVLVTAAFMTSYGTQKAAERDGWETVFEVKFADFGEQHGVTYEDCPPIGKLMVGRAS